MNKNSKHGEDLKSLEMNDNNMELRKKVMLMRLVFLFFAVLGVFNTFVYFLLKIYWVVAISILITICAIFLFIRDDLVRRWFK